MSIENQIRRGEFQSKGQGQKRALLLLLAQISRQTLLRMMAPCSASFRAGTGIAGRLDETLLGTGGLLCGLILNHLLFALFEQLLHGIDLFLHDLGRW